MSATGEVGLCRNLGEPEPNQARCRSGVHQKCDRAYLGPLEPALDHVLKVTRSYRRGLCHCDRNAEIHALYEELNIEQSTERSDLVIQGTVVGKEKSRWNTPDGKFPANTQVADLTQDHTIFTDVHVRIDNVLKGSSTDNTVLVRLMGGEVDGDRIETDELILEDGQSYILFLSEKDGLTKDVGNKHLILLSGELSIYKIENGTASSVKETKSVDALIKEIKGQSK